MFIQRWTKFINERFEPISHTLMIVTFFGANAFFAAEISGLAAEPIQLGAALAVCGLMFFHLRLFDEWKDYDVDCRVNPDRPLPRGLIDRGEYVVVTIAVIAAQLLLAALIGWPALVAAAVAVGYSLLMFKEFFIGHRLRPRLELYALTHTLIAAFIAAFIFSATTGVPIHQIPLEFIAVMTMGWMLFNIFEFARKTYASEEERPQVESYSKRLSPIGATALVLIPAAACLALLAFLTHVGVVPVVLFAIAAGLTAVATLASLGYVVINQKLVARMYRAVHSVYLILFNALFAGYELFAIS